jgi:hypothetical protein
VWAPGHSTSGTPTAEYAYSITKTAPSWVSTKVLGPNGNQITSFDIFDGMLRPRQAQTTAPDGNRVTADTVYDHRGQPGTTSTFYNDASGPASTLVTFNDEDVDRQVRYVYDGRGRQTEEQRWSQDAMLYKHTTVHGYRNTLSTPPQGGTVSRQIFHRLADAQALAESTATLAMRAQWTPQEVAAAIYNVGDSNYLQAVQIHGDLGPHATTYVTTIRRYYKHTDAVVCHSGIWTC